MQKFEKVLKTFKKAKHELCEILSAVEVIDAPSLKLVDEFFNLQSPIGEYPYYLIIETSGSNEKHDFEKMEKFLETALLQHFVLNGIVTSEPSKQKVRQYAEPPIKESTINLMMSIIKYLLPKNFFVKVKYL